MVGPAGRVKHFFLHAPGDGVEKGEVIPVTRAAGVSGCKIHHALDAVGEEPPLGGGELPGGAAVVVVFAEHDAVAGGAVLGADAVVNVVGLVGLAVAVAIHVDAVKTAAVRPHEVGEAGLVEEAFAPGGHFQGELGGLVDDAAVKRIGFAGEAGEAGEEGGEVVRLEMPPVEKARGGFAVIAVLGERSGDGGAEAVVMCAPGGVEPADIAGVGGLKPAAEGGAGGGRVVGPALPFVVETPEADAVVERAAGLGEDVLAHIVTEVAERGRIEEVELVEAAGPGCATGIERDGEIAIAVRRHGDAAGLDRLGETVGQAFAGDDEAVESQPVGLAVGGRCGAGLAVRESGGGGRQLSEGVALGEGEAGVPVDKAHREKSGCGVGHGSAGGVMRGNRSCPFKSGRARTGGFPSPARR